MTNSSVVSGITIVIEKFAETAIDTSKQGDIWTCLLFFLAFVGLVSLSYAIFNNVFKGFKLVFYGVVLIPMIFFVSIFNKKNRKKRLQEWGEIKKNFKGVKTWKWYLYLIIKLVVPLILVIFGIMFFF